MREIDKPTERKISAYIHIPFCEHICYYCDFNKVFLEGQPVDQYLSALINEMKLWLEQHPVTQLDTVYIGGGTPTTLSPKQLDFLLSGIYEYLPIKKIKEFTIEGNPGDFSEEQIHVLRNHHINRISLGVQTFDDQLLKKIGRKHTGKDVYDTLKLLELHDFTNISIDLIYALPNQTVSNFEDTINKALSLDLSHYSLYSLILENKTQFANWARKGSLHLPSEDIESEMFELAIEKMEATGRSQYEISNFAYSGCESQHNLVYWNNEHYYGFGAGASGYIGNTRYRNHGPIQHYIQPLESNQFPIVEKEHLTKDNQMEEELFLGLRKRSGISISTFENKFDIPLMQVFGSAIEQLVIQGLLTCDKDQVSMTKKGLFMGNEVFEKFLLS